MAGKIALVDTFTVSSPVATVILGGGSSGSSGLNASIDTNDIYMLVANGIVVSSSYDGRLRVTVGGVPDTSASYEFKFMGFRNDTNAFSTLGSTTADAFQQVFGWSGYTTSGINANGVVYLYRFNDASEYSYITQHSANEWQNGVLGSAGGGMHKVNQSCDGVQWYGTAGNITAGTFTLYKVL